MTNWPTLFWIGAMASAWSLEGIPANSCSQNARTTGSCSRPTMERRYAASPSSCTRETSDAPGISSSASKQLRKICSKRGPHESP